MHEEGRSVSKSSEILIYEIREICGELIRALEDGVETTSQLAEVVQRQTRRLALIFHQLSHLHSRNGGDH